MNSKKLTSFEVNPNNCNIPKITANITIPTKLKINKKRTKLEKSLSRAVSNLYFIFLNI